LRIEERECESEREREMGKEREGERERERDWASIFYSRPITTDRIETNFLSLGVSVLGQNGGGCHVQIFFVGYIWKPRRRFGKDVEQKFRFC
jgi:hypothetical protein